MWCATRQEDSEKLKSSVSPVVQTAGDIFMQPSILHISVKTLDAARESGLLSYIQYTENGSVFFTEQMLQEYMARSVRRARPIETRHTYRNPRNRSRY